MKLEGAGFKVTAAFDGQKALEILSKEEFDLVLLDLIMPKIDGFEVLRQLQARNFTTPIIVTTNLGQEEDKEKVVKLGVTEFLVKSDTEITQIVEHVKKILHA